MVRRLVAVLGSAIFLVVAPGTVAGLVPRWISRWEMKAPLLGFGGFLAGEVALMDGGVPPVLESVPRGALQGPRQPRPVVPLALQAVSRLESPVRQAA